MKVENGSKVSLDYEGKFENGEVFDSSSRNSPLEFVVGSGQVIPGFNNAVLDMEEGEEKEFEIAPEYAYGEINEELKKEIPLAVLPRDKKPKIGMTLVMNTPSGQQIPARIAKINNESVIIDLNHPLAGKKLVFKINLIKVSSPLMENEKMTNEIKERISGIGEQEQEGENEGADDSEEYENNEE